MLAQGRRRHSIVQRGLRESHSQTGVRPAPDHIAIDRLKEAPGLEMRVAEEIGRIEHRCRFEACALQLMRKLIAKVFARPRTEQFVEIFSIAKAPLRIGETRLANPCGISHHLDEALPFGIAIYCDYDPAVRFSRRIASMRRHPMMPIADTFPYASVHLIVEQRLRGSGHDRLKLREVDMLPLAAARALVERDHNRQRAVPRPKECHPASGPRK